MAGFFFCVCVVFCGGDYIILDIPIEAHSLREDQDFYSWNAKRNKESKLRLDFHGQNRLSMLISAILVRKTTH